MRAVNLLPKDDNSQGRVGPPLPVLVGCVGTVLVTALLAVLFLSGSSSVAHQRSALQAAQARFSALPTPAPPSPVTKDLPQQHQTRVTALASALGQRIVWDRLLREVSQVLPSDVWLVTMNALAPSLSPGGASGSPQGFTVIGCTYSQDSVARFLARLDLVPDLTGMTLGRSSAASDGSTGPNLCPQNMITFTLQGSVRVGSASS